MELYVFFQQLSRYRRELPYGEYIICCVCDLSAMPGKHLTIYKLSLSLCVCERECQECGSEREREQREQCVVCVGRVMDVVFLCRGNWSRGH